MPPGGAMQPRERKALKARAHALDPIVHIGDKGLTAAVLAEIDRALASHELIKVRAGGMDRDARDAALSEICARLGAQPVQHIGKVLVIFRARPEAAPA
jgi:RNA-binding protein